jgi:hypothetical protein
MSTDHLCDDVIDIRITPLSSDDRHQNARRTESALKPMVFVERLLDRVKIARSSERLDGLDLAAGGLNREHEARTCGFAIDDHCACTANAPLASDVSTGQPKVVPQEVAQQTSRLDLSKIVATVHPHFHRCGPVRHGWFHHGPPLD